MRYVNRTLLAVTCVFLSGCAGIQASLAGLGGPELAQNGQPVAEYQLRSHLRSGAADSVLTLLRNEENGTPDDELLKGLYVGLAASYAGEYETSSAALQFAADLAEDRYTESVSEGAAALITNDNALGYEPGQTERLFIHYYGMMNHVEQGDAEGAAVEARRIGNLLQRFDEEQDTVDIATRATMRYVAGAAFEMAGRKNDASVSYRNALALLGDETESRLPVVEAPSAGHGTLIVAVEHGFVAHRVESSLAIALTRGETSAFKGDNVGEQAAVAGLVAARVAAGLAGKPGSGLYWDGPDSEIVIGNLARAYHVLNIAWPTFKRPDNEEFSAVLKAEGKSFDVTPVADVSDAILGDFQRARTGILARTIGRAAVKMFAAEQIRNEAGVIAGALANLGAGLLESADIRSWQMLPGTIGIARVDLEAGTYPDGHLSIQVPDRNNGGVRKLSLGEVTIADGGTALVRVRTF